MTVYQPKHLMSQYRLGLFRVAKGILAPGLAVGFGLGDDSRCIQAPGFWDYAR